MKLTRFPSKCLDVIETLRNFVRSLKIFQHTCTWASGKLIEYVDRSPRVGLGLRAFADRPGPPAEYALRPSPHATPHQGCSNLH